MDSRPVSDAEVEAFDAAYDSVAEMFAPDEMTDGHFHAAHAGLLAFAKARDPLVASQALRDAAAALSACITCGEAHQYRKVSSPGELVERYSWASPIDGHTYQSLSWNRLGISHERLCAWLIGRAAAVGVPP